MPPCPPRRIPLVEDVVDPCNVAAPAGRVSRILPLRDGRRRGRPSSSTSPSSSSTASGSFLFLFLPPAGLPCFFLGDGAASDPSLPPASSGTADRPFLLPAFFGAAFFLFAFFRRRSGPMSRTTLQ